MAKKQGATSKRQAIREQRERKQRQQRTTTILVLTGVAILIAAFLIAPSIQRALTPVGEITTVEPIERPMVDGTAMGDPNAPVLIQVFEDFQCPSCRIYSEDIEPAIVETYVQTGIARYEFHQYPFLDDRTATKESDQAANASLCAAEQNRFWDFHDMLFANLNGEHQGAFADKRLVAYAEAIELDMDAFNACFESNKYKDQITQDLNEGARLGVTGTPSVFVNGQIVRPGFIPTFEDIQQAVTAAQAGG
jgi:protein-disulfide isomerase